LVLIKSDFAIVGWVGSPALFGAAFLLVKSHKGAP
jgi:hypothetical protein